MLALFKKKRIPKLTIRPETERDHDTVHDLVERAFRNEEISDHTEQYLVRRLRKSDAYIPELSLIAEQGDIIIGHIQLTHLHIEDDGINHPSLALAPLSILPEYQSKGVGSSLIKEAHKIATEMGFSSIILIGHPKYYPRFGYEKLRKYNITMPFDAPPESCMIKYLDESVKGKIKGKVVYDSAFFM